jgi:hypothetical protein
MSTASKSKILFGTPPVALTHLQSITNANIDRFIGLLEQAENDPDRERFRSLLVAEEDRFAREEHRRDALQRCLGTVTDKIERHARLMDDMRRRGSEMDGAQALMTNLLFIQSTLVMVRTFRSGD